MGEMPEAEELEIVGVPYRAKGGAFITRKGTGLGRYLQLLIMAYNIDKVV